LRLEPATLEVKGRCANHFATEAPKMQRDPNQNTKAQNLRIGAFLFKSSVEGKARIKCFKCVVLGRGVSGDEFPLIDFAMEITRRKALHEQVFRHKEHLEGNARIYGQSSLSSLWTYQGSNRQNKPNAEYMYNSLRMCTQQRYQSFVIEIC
jgi:hypothetical protein